MAHSHPLEDPAFDQTLRALEEVEAVCRVKVVPCSCGALERLENQVLEYLEEADTASSGLEVWQELERLRVALEAKQGFVTAFFAAADLKNGLLAHQRAREEATLALRGYCDHCEAQEALRLEAERSADEPTETLESFADLLRK